METKAFSITKEEAGQIAKPSFFRIAKDIIQRAVLNYDDNIQFIVSDDNLYIGSKAEYFPNDFIDAVKKVCEFYGLRQWITTSYHFSDFKEGLELHLYYL